MCVCVDCVRLGPQENPIRSGKRLADIREVSARIVRRLLSSSSSSSRRSRRRRLRLLGTCSGGNYFVFSLFYWHASKLEHGSKLRHVALGIAEQTPTCVVLFCFIIWKVSKLQIPIRTATSYPIGLIITLDVRR